MRNPTRRRGRVATAMAALGLAAGLVGIAGPAASPAGALPSHASIPIASFVGSGPQSGDLGNGVHWSVDKGAPSPTQANAYAIVPSDVSQTWTFNRPVDVTWSITGLNCTGEGVVLPAGTDADSIALDHTWDPGTLTITGNPAALGSKSFFSRDNVTSLTFTSVGGAANCSRGPADMEVGAEEPWDRIDCDTSTVYVAQSVSAGPGVVGTQLSKLEAGSGSSTFVPVGAPAVPTYNSIAFDPDSRVIIGNDTQGNLIAVDADGDVTKLGAIGVSNNGAIDNGVYYAYAGNGASITTVDLNTMAVGSIPLTPAAPTADFTFVDGLLWGNGASSQTLIRIDPATGTVTAFPAPFLDPGTTAGAVWTYPNGNLGLSNNSNGKIYQIAITGGSTPTPTFTLIATSTGPASSGNDGTSCDGLPADLSIAKSNNGSVAPGGTMEWTITVTNEGPGDSSGYVVKDIVPPGVTNVASSTPGCTVANNTVTCVGGVLAAGDNDEIFITGTAPASSGVVTNTATVTGNEPDGDPTDNSVTNDTTVTAVISGLCRGTAVQLLGLKLGSANTPESPCVTQTANLALVTQTIGTAFPWPLSALTSSLKASAVGSNTLSNPRLAAAESHVAALVLNLPLIGLNLAVTGVQTTATATLPATGCGPTSLAGTSIVASAVLNGGVLVVGSKPVSIPLLGLGGVYLNQRVIQGNVITQRAVFVDLPGTALDVTVAETKASIACS